MTFVKNLLYTRPMNLEAAISSIMTTSIDCVTPDQKIIDIKHIYEQPQFHSHVPVNENGKVVGIVSIVNFMRAIHDASLDDNETVYHEISVRDIMTPSPSTASPKSTIREVAAVLSKGDFHSMLITEENELKGIVTTTDILKLMLKD